MAEIKKWTRLVDTSSHSFSSFVNSQPFIYASHLPFVVHFLIMHHFLLLCFDQDQVHEYQVQFLHYFLFHRLNQALRPFSDFIQQFSPGSTGQ
jgi:hypothetical protein